MYRENMKRYCKPLQKGFSMITAIFLLVVLGTLGTMMVTFFAAQQQSSAMDVTGSRTYQAARAGIEWAAYNISITPQGSLWGGCVAAGNPLGVLAGSLSPFTVTINCTASNPPITEGTGPVIYVYSITSTAVAGGAPGNRDYVERVITATFGR
jgi:MSHA biogenesis protein MshP